MALESVRFSLADDDNPGLVRLLIAALRGDPVNDRRAETDSYIEGSVQRSHDKVRVRLARFNVNGYRLNVVWRRDFPLHTDVEEIAQCAAGTFGQETPLSACGKEPNMKAKPPLATRSPNKVAVANAAR